MTLTLLDRISLAADDAKPNEDAFAHSSHAALVLDGATPLGSSLLPGPSDAAWIAQFGARRLMAHLKDGDAPEDALTHALEDARKSFEGLSRQPIKEKWQTPCAAMMMAVEQGERIEFLWFADCAALVLQNRSVTLIGEAMEARRREAGRAKLVAQQTGTVPTDRETFMPALRAARNRINSGSHWLFTPEPRAAAHVARQTEKLAAGSLLLLASDGFLALASDYDAYDLNGLVTAAKAKGLATLGEELRAIEQADPQGAKHPRFKTSDDATALLLEVS
jgi:hypothetical protein